MASTAVSSRWQQPQPQPNSTTLATVQQVLDDIAPPSLAGSWDNVGLLVGTPQQTVSRALVTIDLTAAVLEEAAAMDADLIIAYHPPLFSAIKRFTKAPLVQRAAAAGCAIYSPHTALDAAPGGTNDVLAERLGLEDVSPLQPAAPPAEHKLVVFVPPENVEGVLAAMHATGAGVIGEYDSCAFRHPGTGSFRGSDSSNPHIGTAGQHETVEELRVEVVVPPQKLEAVVAALRRAHPYEEPAFDIFERVAPSSASIGQGRIGTLKGVQRADLIGHLKAALGLKHVMIAEPPQAAASGSGQPSFWKVGLCAGAGSDLIDDALAAGANVFLTGEMRHHDALRAVAAGLTVFTTLHSNSERMALPPYAERIRKRLPDIEVRISEADRDPFTIV